MIERHIEFIVTTPETSQKLWMWKAQIKQNRPPIYQWRKLLGDDDQWYVEKDTDNRYPGVTICFVDAWTTTELLYVLKKLEVDHRFIENALTKDWYNGTDTPQGALAKLLLWVLKQEEK